MGATRLIPGSHMLGEGRQFEQSDTVPAEMKRGSVLLYSAKIYHGSGVNRSDKVRKALNVNYNAAWLRQEENQYLSCPPEIARTLPQPLLERQQRPVCDRPPQKMLRCLFGSLGPVIAFRIRT